MQVEQTSNHVPAVSVVLPVYNGEQYIVAAVRSVLSQTLTDFECIVINDGSTDRSGELVNDLALEDSRIILVSRENRGLIASLNQGIEMARGEFIARMDADDLCLPERFAVQVELLRQSGADLCGSHHFIIDDRGATSGCFIAPLSVDAIRLVLGNTNPFAHGNVMLRKSFLQKHGLQYGSHGVNAVEDYGLWLEMAGLGARFINADSFLFAYRDFGTSFSKGKKNNMLAERRRLSRKYIRQNRNEITQSLRRIDLDAHRSFHVQENVVYTAWIHFLVNRNLSFFSLLRKVRRINLPRILATLLSGRY